MKLKKKKHDKKIKIYYYDKVSEGLIEDGIKLFYKNNFDDKYHLIRDRIDRKVFKLKVDKQTYYLKFFQYRKVKKTIKNFFRPEEAVRSFKKAYKLSVADIPVVEPVVAITYRRGLFKFDSILITKGCKSITVKESLPYINNNKVLRRKIIKNMAKLWAKLFNNNFIHKDYNLSNFMVNLDNCSLILADLDNIYNIYLNHFLFKKLMIKNLARFNARLLYDLVEDNIIMLSYKERMLFFKKFIKKYNKNISFKKIITKINKQTIKRLIEKNQKSLISKDKWLTKL